MFHIREGFQGERLEEKISPLDDAYLAGMVASDHAQREANSIRDYSALGERVHVEREDNPDNMRFLVESVNSPVYIVEVEPNPTFITGPIEP